MSFPLKHYRGISVVINLKIVAENPSEILSESGIDILDFKEKFCAAFAGEEQRPALSDILSYTHQSVVRKFL